MAGRPRRPTKTVHGAQERLREVPRAPRWLSAEARDAWRSTGEALAKAGLLSAATIPLLESYSIAMGAARQAEQSISEQGAYFVAKKGPPIVHPAVAHREKALALSRLFASKLGISPDREHTPAPDPDSVAGGDEFGL